MAPQPDPTAQHRDTEHQWVPPMVVMAHRRECLQVRQGPWLVRLPVLCLVRHPVAEEQAGWVVLVAGKQLVHLKKIDPSTRKSCRRKGGGFFLAELIYSR